MDSECPSRYAAARISQAKQGLGRTNARALPRVADQQLAGSRWWLMGTEAGSDEADDGGAIKVKETMAITMIDPAEVIAREFEDSHLHEKLRRTLVAARLFESRQELRSELLSAGVFDLDRPDIFAQVRKDYELVRRTIREQGFGALSGRMGALVQPRTKGPGHGSTSRAFYARTGFVAHILGM